jgi:hypothetical protein
MGTDDSLVEAKMAANWVDMEGNEDNVSQITWHASQASVG